MFFWVLATKLACFSPLALPILPACFSLRLYFTTAVVYLQWASVASWFFRPPHPRAADSADSFIFAPLCTVN
jgi:hypothetical protein